MDYRENPDAATDLLNELEEGDRIHLEADTAVVPEDGTKLERGGRILIDNHATVMGKDDDGDIKVELEKWIKDGGEPDKWSTNEFIIGGGIVIAEWKDIRDEDEKESGPTKKPVDTPVAILNTVERIDE